MHCVERVKRPPAWAARGVVLGTTGLLWGLSGWTWTVAAVALGAAVGTALVARFVGFLLPREGGWIGAQAGRLCVGAGLCALVVVSSVWTVLLAVGLAVAVLALTQSREVGRIAVGVGAVLAVVGASGVAVQVLRARADEEAAYRAAGDVARGRMLPQAPADALVALMRAVRRSNDPAGCTLLLDDAAAAQFAAAYGAPDCPAALRAAGAGVDDRSRYDHPDYNSLRVDQPDPHGPAVVDGCAVRWPPTLDEILRGSSAAPARPPGPALGVVTIAPAYGTGWQIPAFRRCGS